jgi:hypothetical protein
MEAANFDRNNLNPEFIHQHVFFALYLIPIPNQHTKIE